MPFPYIWLFVVQQIRTCSFSIKFENNKKTQIFAFIFLIKRILSPIFCTCRTLQVFSFPFTKKICHQTSGGLKNYHSIRAMLAKRVIFLFLTKRNAWGIPHVSGMQHKLPLFCVFLMCRVIQFHRQNITLIVFFSSQISSKLPW